MIDPPYHSVPQGLETAAAGGGMPGLGEVKQTPSATLAFTVLRVL